MSKQSATPIVITPSEWNTAGIRYMQPKVNDRGAKTINIISTQSNRSLHISTPLMMTWGIADFMDENGNADGKYKISLNFPNDQYKTAATTEFLQKMKDFENQVLDDAVKNSEIWFGEEMSRDVAKHTFFPFLKYSKDKITKKFDYTKPPSIHAKVPNYGGRWAVEIYDTSSNLLFPCDDPQMSPVDFVPKQSNVACVLQCGGIWFGGKGWGVTWKLNQCVVKPREVVSVYGRCHIQLSSDELSAIEKPVPTTGDDDEEAAEVVTPKVVDTHVDDSDEEEAEPVKQPQPAAVVVKKVVKKALPEPVAQPVADVASEAAVEPAKKKVVKKKV
jgi:hypothetical protein